MLPAYTIPNLFYLHPVGMSRKNMEKKKKRPTICSVAFEKTTIGDLPAEYPLTTQPLRDKITPMRAWGSKGAPPVAESSDLSEWPRSADEEAAPTATKLPGTATGGIGRHKAEIRSRKIEKLA